MTLPVTSSHFVNRVNKQINKTNISKLHTLPFRGITKSHYMPMSLNLFFLFQKKFQDFPTSIVSAH